MPSARSATASRTDKTSIHRVTGLMEQQIATLPTEAMFVAAIRLHDLGETENAVFWFVAACYRAKLFRRALVSPGEDPSDAAFEACQAHAAFQTLILEHINPRLIDEPRMWIKATERVCDRVRQVPAFRPIYRDLKFVEPDRLKELNDEEAADYAELLRSPGSGTASNPLPTR